MRSKLIGALLVTILLSFGLWSYRGEAANETVTSYEYQVLVEDLSQHFKKLNHAGAQGWELVTVISDEKNGQTILYLKRVRKSG